MTRNIRDIVFCERNISIYTSDKS